MKYIALIMSLVVGLVAEAEITKEMKAQYQRPDTIPFPADNPYQAEKAALGKMLFFDPRLSINENISCATCHNPSFGWEQALPLAVGAQNTALGRHNPTILNLAWGDKFFWDGRAATLEEQALGPIQSDVEMNMPLDVLIERVSGIEGYRPYFNSIFSEGITAETIAKAIATFERTVVSGPSPFDRWIEGDESALSDSAKRGFELFNGKAKCSTCHTGWNFTDNKFHDIGLPTLDEGRFVIDPSSELNRHAFKTPGLRNITHRAPYMHNGSLANLDAVLVHYLSGGLPRPSRSPEIGFLPLMNDDLTDLKAFLHTLQGEDQPMSLPALPL
jgi:cytochrome c peroxidase|tara:strand:- start:6393 stop:7382 length:990 start_codon:yes stop_codon:yes gene_type:complete